MKSLADSKQDNAGSAQTAAASRARVTMATLSMAIKEKESQGESAGNCWSERGCRAGFRKFSRASGRSLARSPSIGAALRQKTYGLNSSVKCESQIKFANFHLKFVSMPRAGASTAGANNPH
jgi:hypothetical protein